MHSCSLGALNLSHFCRKHRVAQANVEQKAMMPHSRGTCALSLTRRRTGPAGGGQVRPGEGARPPGSVLLFGPSNALVVFIYVFRSDGLGALHWSSFCLLCFEEVTN